MRGRCHGKVSSLAGEIPILRSGVLDHFHRSCAFVVVPCHKKRSLAGENPILRLGVLGHFLRFFGNGRFWAILSSNEPPHLQIAECGSKNAMEYNGG